MVGWNAREVTMRTKVRKLIGGFLAALGFAAIGGAQQIGKYVPIAAGSDADHAMQEINATTDTAQKLAFIDKFASNFGQGNMAIVANELYVNYYLSQKNYAKTYEYGDKLFAVDPDNLANAVSLVRAASEAGDTAKLMTYGETSSGILKRFRASTPPEGTNEETWNQQKESALRASAESIQYIEQAVYSGVYQTKDAARRGDQLAHFAELFPDSPYTIPALGVAAASYQTAQNPPKMLQVANGLLAKDPNNLGMLLLLSDYYGEKGEQLDKAEAYAKKAASLADSTPKPEGVSDDDWKKQTTLQKGLALCTLGQVNLQKKDNAAAATSFQAAAPLLKANDQSYARNEYRLGYAFLNLKKLPEAKQAFTEAASVESPYKQPALDKLKTLPAKAPVTRRKAS